MYYITNTIQIKLRWAFICHIHNYTDYNEEWNVCSAFNPSKWSSGQPTLQRPGEQLGVCCLAQGSHLSRGTLPARARIWTHNLELLRVSSPMLYPLGHYSPGPRLPWGHDSPTLLVYKSCTMVKGLQECIVEACFSMSLFREGHCPIDALSKYPHLQSWPLESACCDRKCGKTVPGLKYAKPQCP